MFLSPPGIDKSGQFTKSSHQFRAAHEMLKTHSIENTIATVSKQTPFITFHPLMMRPTICNSIY